MFPVFQIQRKLQKRIFGIQFWEGVERSVKEDFGTGRKDVNNFNPRHVQILLRTYQTGGAAAVLSHTGDPNKGIRDWYENQKQHDEAKVETGDEMPSSGLQRWKSVRDTITSRARVTRQWSSVRKSVLEGDTMKKLKSKRTKSKKDNEVDAVASASASDLFKVTKTNTNKSSKDGDVASALRRIRANRAQITPMKETPGNGQEKVGRSDVLSNRPETPSSPPPDVADALRQIRLKRTQIADPDCARQRRGTTRVQTRKGRPSSTIKGADVPNVRRRQAGSLFASRGQTSGSGWLK